MLNLMMFSLVQGQFVSEEKGKKIKFPSGQKDIFLNIKPISLYCFPFGRSANSDETSLIKQPEN
jgi:hypothetical protein